MHVCASLSSCTGACACVFAMCITFYYRYCVTHNKSSYYYGISRLAIYSSLLLSNYVGEQNIVLLPKHSAFSGWIHKYLLYIYVNARFKTPHRCMAGRQAFAFWVRFAFSMCVCVCLLLSVLVLRTIGWLDCWSCCGACC